MSAEEVSVMHHMGDGMLSPCGLPPAAVYRGFQAGFTTEWSDVDCPKCLAYKPKGGTEVSKLGQLPLNEHGFPIYPKGTPIPEVKEFDRGQKVVMVCKNHPLSVWASKDPYVSRWFAARREYEECDCPLAWYVLAEDYSPTRNG